jgi:hypothetical protein
MDAFSSYELRCNDWGIPIYCHVFSDYRRVLDWQSDLLDTITARNNIL